MMGLLKLLRDFYIIGVSAADGLSPSNYSLEQRTETAQEEIDPRFRRMSKNKMLTSIYHNLIGLSRKGVKDYYR